MTNFIVPYIFVPGTKAKAQEVNANFDAMKEELGLKALKTGDETQTFSVASATEDCHAMTKLQTETLITTCQDSLTKEVNKKDVLFCCNSGNVDSSGNADLLEYEGLQLTFKVGGDYSNLTATNTEGEKFNFSSISALDFTGFSDGTYNIFIDEDGTTTILANTIYAQRNTPTMLVNDIWLNTSIEPLMAYQFDGSAKNNFTKVPLGSVTIASSTISAVKTFKYNQNGYEFNKNSTKAYLIDTYVSGKYGYNLYSNNFIEQWGRMTPYYTDGTNTINLLKTMADTNYQIIFTANEATTGYKVYRYQSLSTTSFVVYGYGSVSTVTELMWKVSGYAS